jgi:hypothetical protein
MRPAPFFERLSEAYAVIDGIPNHQITLDIEQVSAAQEMLSIGVNDGRYMEPTNWDALILTPDMWLSLCPAYIDLVWPLLENWESFGVEVFWRIEGRVTSRFEVAMAHLFNLTQDEAEILFGMRSDDELDGRSDKQVFLDRIIAFLKERGQEVTVGTGHIDQDEMLEHGISLLEPVSSNADETVNAKTLSSSQKKAHSPLGIQTGFAALAFETDVPGAETFDTEAAATTVNPIIQEQSVEQDSENS